MNINLREEETIQYISFYQRYLEDVQSLNNKVMDVLNEVMQQSKYDKLQQRIFGIIDAYMETIVNNIETGVFTTWKESEGSLRSCLRTYRAGTAADEVCAQIEQQMEDLMQDILKIEKADLIVTERPIVSEDGLEQLEDICRTAQTEIQNLKTEYASQVLSKELDNDIYGTLRPLIEGVATNIEAFFEASLNSFIELHEFVSGISVQLHNIAEEQEVSSLTSDGISKKSVVDSVPIASEMEPSFTTIETIDGDKEPDEILDDSTLNKVIVVFGTYIDSSLDLIRGLVEKGDGTKEIASAFSILRHELLVASNLDFQRLHEEYMSENDKVIINRIKNNYCKFDGYLNGFDANFYNRHNYSKLIKHLNPSGRYSEVGTIDKDVNINELGKRQYDFFKKAKDNILQITNYDIWLQDSVIELLCIVADIIDGFYKKTKLSRGFVILHKYNNQENRISKDPKIDYQGYDAKKMEHFEVKPEGGKLGKLKPNIQYYYKVDGHTKVYDKCTTYYNYETDSKGRIIHAYTGMILLGEKEERNNKYTSKVGASGGRGKGKSGKNLDDGGHIFASKVFGGSDLIDNLLPQASEINQAASDPNNRKSYKGGQWRRLENRIEGWLNDEHIRYVTVDIEIDYETEVHNINYSENRPDYYHVILKAVNNDPDDNGMCSYSDKDFGIKNDLVISLSKNRKIL